MLLVTEYPSPVGVTDAASYAWAYKRVESPRRAGNASGGVKKGEGGTSFPSSASFVLVEVKASALPNWQAF